MFRTGYITDRRGDLIWFLGLPLFALAFALASQQWLSAVVLLSIGLWIEFPHHCATFVRTYALSDDWRRFKERLIVGPIVIVVMLMLGYKWAPLTVLLVSTVWNQQHFVMQLHGFTRIYDFKARTGAPSSGRWDYLLNWIVYVNMFLTAPLFTRIWIRELYRFELPISAEGVRWVHGLSWTITTLFGIAYLGHLIWSAKKGYSLNPIKYLFLVLSYSVLYIVAFHTASILVHAIANMLMHGIQYNVIVFWYLRRKIEQDPQKSGILSSLVRPGGALVFVVTCLLYAVILQAFLKGRPLDEFAFGLFTSMSDYGAIPSLALEPLTKETRFEIMALAVIQLPGTLHLYFDSFIWKVRDARIQKGL